MACWRSIAREFLTRLTALEAAGEALDPALADLAAVAPPMTGGEYLSAETLAAIWTGLGRAVRAPWRVRQA